MVGYNIILAGRIYIFRVHDQPQDGYLLLISKCFDCYIVPRLQSPGFGKEMIQPYSFLLKRELYVSRCPYYLHYASLNPDPDYDCDTCANLRRRMYR
jgi:hypothetical protein